MLINRRFLYLGVFLVAVGGVLVAADVGGLDPGLIADALRLWPLAIVAIGVGIALRRTQFSLQGGLLAAAVPGLLLGGGFSLASRMAVECRPDAAPATVATREGDFDGPARVSVTAGCGSLAVTTVPGRTWRFDDGNPADGPIIDASGRSLSIDDGGGEGWRRLGLGRDDWRLTLPTTGIDDLSIVVNGGEGRIALPRAQLGRLDVTSNAGRTSVDLSEATLASLSGAVNAGMLSLSLPTAGDIVGSVEVNAGQLEVCAPSELGLRIHHTGALSGFSVSGRHQAGTEWQSPDYASATHHADLNLDINLGNVKINPAGGCK